MNEEHYIKCPSCGGEILPTLVKCIYCQSILKKKADETFKSLKYKTIDLHGGTYAGELLNDKPHGQGTLTLPNGATYSGFWKDGNPNGKGKLKKSDGGTYEGDFQNGKRHGLGKYSYPDGRQLEGEWENGDFIRPVAKTNHFETDMYEKQDRASQSIADKDAKAILENYIIEQQKYKNNNPDTNKWWVWLVVIILSIIIAFTTMSAFFSIIAGLILLILGVINIIKPLSSISIYNRGITLLILSVGLIMLFVGTTISLSGISSPTSVDLNEIREHAREIPYDELARYPNTHKGTPVIHKGKIIQKISDTSFRVNITIGSYGIWSDTVYVKNYGEASKVRLLEDDIIVFIGIAQGEITYESIFGQNITIPRIDAYEVKLTR